MSNLTEKFDFIDLISVFTLDKFPAVQWGRTHEKDGIKALKDRIANNVVSTSVWLHQSGVLGATPDGLINDEYVVEVKCPFKFRQRKIIECLKETNDFILRLDGNYVVINKNHDYYHQIQGQIHLTNRQKCYLVIWTTMDTQVFLIEKDIDWTPNIEILLDFYFKQFLPMITL